MTTEAKNIQELKMRPNIELGLSLDYRLRWFDFDRFGHLKPSVVFDILQDTATVHAEACGIGWGAMHEQGVFWAIIRLKYQVVREPERFQVITASTWPHSPSRFSFMRDYDIRDLDGEVLIKATSEWVLINNETRRFAKISDHYNGPTEFLEKRSFDEKPKKLNAVEGDGLIRYTMEPRYTSIDTNGHVNNSCYPGFVMDALDPKDDLAIEELQVDFRQELLPDAPLTMLIRETPERIDASGIHGDGEVAFNCKIIPFPRTEA